MHRAVFEEGKGVTAHILAITGLDKATHGLVLDIELDGEPPGEYLPQDLTAQYAWADPKG